MMAFTKKAAPAPAPAPDDSGNDAEGGSDGALDLALGSSKKGSGAGYGPGSAARAAKDAGAMSSFVIPLTFGEPAAEPNAASGPSVAAEGDIGPDHGNRPDLFAAGLPAQTRKAKEV